MVDTRTDYPADAVAAARAVMLELVRLLGEYRDEIVIVGGWVPELLLPLAQPRHIGSTDVDLALDHRRITEAAYQTIREHLLRHGYLAGTQPFIYFCVMNYPGGLDALVREFRPHLTHGLVAEGLHKIREKFLSPIHIGPKSVADFEEITDREARDLRQRDAFERIGNLLGQLGVA